MQAAAGLEQVYDDQTNDQRQSGNGFKIEQRFQTDPPELSEIFERRDAVDDGAKNDRCDKHFDELDECVAERLEGFAKFRKKMADQSANHDAEQNLDIKVPKDGATVRIDDH